MPSCCSLVCRFSLLRFRPSTCPSLLCFFLRLSPTAFATSAAAVLVDKSFPLLLHYIHRIFLAYSFLVPPVRSSSSGFVCSGSILQDLLRCAGYSFRLSNTSGQPLNPSGLSTDFLTSHTALPFPLVVRGEGEGRVGEQRVSPQRGADHQHGEDEGGRESRAGSGRVSRACQLSREKMLLQSGKLL